MFVKHHQATLEVSEKRLDRAEKAELEGKHDLWRSYVAQAREARTKRFASLRAIKEALALPVPPGHSRAELRIQAIAALCLPDLELARERGSETIGVRGFTIDAAFQRYAIADKDGKVSIRRLSDDEELLQLPGGGLVNEYGGLQFSPDGRFLHQRRQVQGEYRSRLWDLDALQPRAVLDDEHCNLTFRPDGRQYAAFYPDRTVRFFDTASGRELRRFRVAAMPPDCGLSWNPRFPQLLISTHPSLWLLNVDTGEVSSVGPKVPGGCSWADWHPEGRLLAVGGETDCKIYLWDVHTGRLAMPPLEGHKHRGIVVKFNHAGDRLLSTDWSASWHLWDTRSGRLLLTLPAAATTLQFSSDDRLVGSGGSGKVQLFHFRRGTELRTIVHRGTSVQSGFNVDAPSRLDPKGRLLAIWRPDDGIALVDVARGEEAGLLPLPGNMPLRFEPEGALWTCGPAGLLRWPVAADPKTGQRRYGPPQRILPTATSGRQDSSLDGRVVAIPQSSRCAVVFHCDDRRCLRLGPQEDVRSCAVSPDGRWVATGSHHLREGSGAKIWDAHEGKHVKDLPAGGCCRVQFSPDGKWLLTTGGGCRLWVVGSWEEGPSLGGNLLNAFGAFSGDGKMLALGDEPGVVRLIVTDTGAEIARLTAPEQARLSPCCFTPNGTNLVALAETSDLYVFDLHAIRVGLAELDLDWDAPPLPAASTSPAAPLAIDFDLGDLGQWAEADALVRQAAQQIGDKEHAKALAALRKAVRLAPSHAVAHNNLAWLLLTGPKELRDPGQALPEARKTVELEPNPHWINTLGLALYYTGHFAEAIPVLERSLREGKGQTDAFDLFFLAMCHHRLGDAAKAKDCHERGKQWFQKHKGQLPACWVEELTAFQAESEAILAQPPGRAKK